jgi:heme/copper-type cytochrome/quinol oxidase subunit 1
MANLVTIWVDFQGNDAQAFGRVNEMWGQLDWLWGQPMVFAFAIPVLGIVVDSVASATGVRQKGYGLIQGAIGAFGALTFGAYVQPWFAPDVRHNALYVAMVLLAVLPVLVVLGGVADSLRAGRIRFGAHLGLSVFAMLTLLAGVGAAVFAVAGAALGVVSEFDDKALAKAIRWLADLDGTVVATGVMQLALGAALIGAVAGVYHWGPKIFGRKLNTGGGMLAGLALLGGTVLLGGSNIVNGILDEADAVYLPDAYGGVWDISAVEAVNWVGVVGAVLMIAGLGLALLDITASGLLGLGDDENADDPWQGQTLEWATDSPPPLGNFAAAPARVLTPQPLLDVKESDQ